MEGSTSAESSSRPSPGPSSTPAARRRNRRKAEQGQPGGGGGHAALPNGHRGGPNNHRGGRGAEAKDGTRGGGNRRRAPRADGSSAPASAPPDSQDATDSDVQKGRNRRGAKFNAQLSSEPSTNNAPKPNNHGRRGVRAPTVIVADDLTSTLTHALSTAPYPDCPICFSAIHPAQATWSCSPALPSSDEDTANASAVCCWTTFHLKCIKEWAAKSVRELAEAWRARGEDKPGEWRCPGCQTRRETVPRVYWCFCGTTPDPKPPRLATPHSCANTCSRPRACTHQCPLACHPGPCPPCQVVTELSCYCGKQTMAFKCSHTQSGTGAGADLSCRKVCGRKLGCRNHACQEMCHPGPCAPCEVSEEARCYCGKTDKRLACGEGEAKACQLEGGEVWMGRFACLQKCDRPFDCGKHTCSKPCHPPLLTAPPCPFSPSLVTHCPCGKHPLSPSSSASFPPAVQSQLTRTACTDPIPTCTSTCLKPLQGCAHVCSAPCHLGACPPCGIVIVRPCRCGASTRDVRCAEVQASLAAAGTSTSQDDGKEILCDRPCQALRACGRHQCNRICCPLAALAAAQNRKGKKRAAAPPVLEDDVAGLHACDLVCGKTLGCGNHVCEERDHRGKCAPCLRSSFEEMYCFCGRTVLEPPIPCGTRINCSYPCELPRECGHPRTPHTCHAPTAETPCPPCAFLTTKRCACGKNEVGNVRCSQERVSCGTVCGKLMGCGFHHCERLCHGDDCGACTSMCGKPRKLCLPANHPCTQPCHAPASCSESEPCNAIVALTCPCGRIRQTAQCGRSTTRRTDRTPPRCSNECKIAQRNARLAEALGIDNRRAQAQSEVVYGDELKAYGRVNPKFVGMVERTFAEFVGSGRKMQVLPHTPAERRKFVQELANVYRMDTELVDQEPNRSVQLIRRVDTRIPKPLLSDGLRLPQSSSLGKLADLRTSTVPNRSAVRPSAPVATSSSRGWTAVVAPAPPPQHLPLRESPRPRTEAQAVARVASPAAPTQPPVEERDIADVPDNWEDDA